MARALLALAWLGVAAAAAPTMITGAVPTMLATEGGTVVTVSGHGLTGSKEILCRVDPPADGSTHLINATTPAVPARVAGDAVVCAAPPVDAPGPGLLRVSLDGGRSWLDSSANVTYFDQVTVALDRRPYFEETAGALLVRSAGVRGHTIDVAATLPAANASWAWKDVAADADVALPMDFGVLGPNTGLLHNDLLVDVTYDGKTVRKRRRFARAPPPPPGVEAVQVDHARAGLLVAGEPWVGQGWCPPPAFFFSHRATGHRPE